MRKVQLKLVTAAMLAVIAAASLLFTSCRPEGGFFGQDETGLETFETARGNIIQSVSSSGNVESKFDNSYTLQTSGDVLEILEEGDTFKEGDILIMLDGKMAQLLMKQARENLNISQAALDLAKLSYQQALDANHVAVQLAETGQEQSEVAAQDAFKALESANGMASKSIESARVALENAETLYEVALAGGGLTNVQIQTYENNIAAAEAAYESAKVSGKSTQNTAESSYNQAVLGQSTTYWTNLSSKETAEAAIANTANGIEQAEYQLELASINYDIVSLDEGSNVIYAPYDGIVMSSAYKAGEYASPGLPAIEVASSQFVIKSDINETDIINMEVGQEVDIVLDAYYLEELEGEIIKISPVPTNVGGVVSYKVTVEPEPQENVKLLPGLSASLDIITSGVKDILYVPIEAVYDEDDAQWVDVLLSDGTVEAVEVTTGIFNYDFIEIKSGLSEGDKVVLSGLEE